MQKLTTYTLFPLFLIVICLYGMRAFGCPPESANTANAGGPPPAAGAPAAPAGSGSASNSPAPASIPDSSPPPSAAVTTHRAAKAAREPANEPEFKIPIAPYAPKMWSCGCSNIKKTCDKGFVFTSIADATAYAVHICGSSCIPACTGHDRN